MDDDGLNIYFSALWRYRADDFRLTCRIEAEVLVVLVVRVGHRKEVYEG